ncbi:Immunoglobulin A1 protease autotransporter precursor, partial [Haemophilus influenzae]
NL